MKATKYRWNKKDIVMWLGQPIKIAGQTEVPHAALGVVKQTIYGFPLVDFGSINILSTTPNTELEKL